MTGEVWTRYLKKWDTELRLSRRKILLLCDNAPGHPNLNDELAKEFLPKNTASVSNQGLESHDVSF